MILEHADIVWVHWSWGTVREYRLALAEHLEVLEQREVVCSRPATTVSLAADKDASLEHTHFVMVALGFRMSLGYNLEFVGLERAEDTPLVGSRVFE